MLSNQSHKQNGRPGFYPRACRFVYAAEVGLYEQISRLNNHRPFRLPLMRAVSLNLFGTLSVRYELLAPM